MQTVIWITAAFVVCALLYLMPTAWALAVGLVVLFIVRYGVKLWVTRGGGAPTKARLFGRLMFTVEGQTLLFAGRSWERSGVSATWKEVW